MTVISPPAAFTQMPAIGCSSPEQRELYRCFAALLDYPGPDTARLASGTVSKLTTMQAPIHLANFAVYLKLAELGAIEEIYTASFEINPASFIYAGYVLFGESAKRAAFIVKLQQEYQRRDFAFSGELADHLGLMFRFLSIVEDDPVLVQDLLTECIAPAIHQMYQALDPGNPYAELLRAILAVIDPLQQATLAQVLARFGSDFLAERSNV